MQLQTVSSAPSVAFPPMAMCQGMERQAATRIAAVSIRQTIAPGQELFAEGDAAENVYEVVSGMVKLYKLLPDGRRQIMGFISPGHLIGLVHRGAYVYTAEAITEVTLCRYPLARFTRLIDEVPGFAKRLLDVHSDELSAAHDQMLLLGRKTAVEKVASFLLMMAEGQHEDCDDVYVPMTRTDIADYLGLTIETVSRTLTKLKAEGVIGRRGADCITVQDRDRLDTLAAGEALETL
ncbi:MAG: helix-turn-helix domain-containing protein [Gemmatimonas sp.]